MPGTARIGPIEMTGFDGPMTIARARGDRLEHLARSARAASAPAQLDAVDRALARARGS